jgi:hypothetical protein
MSSPRALAILLALPFAACGGAVLTRVAPDDDAGADAGVEGATKPDAASLPQDGGDAGATDANGDADSADALAPAFDAAACGTVYKGCMGAAGCGANSAPMPLGCAGAMTCEDFCQARTQCSISAMQCRTDGGSFYCYTCNP